ncbi:hypothetical protein ACC675_38280, partial [Rhizobium ruizarguesonis]
MDQALRDRKLLGAALGASPSWDTWIAILRAAFGLDLSAEEQEAFGSVAGGRDVPPQRVRDLWAAATRDLPERRTM